MRLRVLPLLLCLPVPALADPPSTVRGEDVVVVAAAALRDRLKAQGIAQPELRPVGEVRVPTVGAFGEATLVAGEIDGRLPRPRVAVPVSVQGADGSAARLAVWFAVQAPVEAWVHGTDAARGTDTALLSAQRATVDLARVDPGQLVAPVDLQGKQLRRPVRAGAPLLAADFEPAPDVRRDERLALRVRSGAVRISTQAVAMDEARIGQRLRVLAAGAEAPIEAVLVSRGVAEVEH